MSVPLLMNIMVAAMLLISFMLPFRWMFAAWAYCYVTMMIIKKFYPEYWATLIPG